MPPLLRTLLLSVAAVRGQEGSSCCAASTTQLAFDTPVASSVGPGAWTDFYIAGQNEGDSLAFEVTALASFPTALSVHVYDGAVADQSTPAADRCVLCQDGTPTSNVAITSVSSLHPTGPPATGQAALDSDHVSHIGNTTHRRYFVYVGECYHMRGSIYYVSVYGPTTSTVHFTIEAKRVQSALAIGTSTAATATTGSVCDGKYMHYYVDWPAVHPGGLQAAVRKTSGELESFAMRYERCAGQRSSNIANVNLLGHG